MPDLLITIRNIVTGGKDVKDFGQSLTELKSGIDMAKDAASQAAEVFQQAWDLSKEGAQLNDLTASFERMNSEVFKTPNLLDDMVAATNNTIAKADAMKGILTLSAGATDSAAQAYAAAAPRLLEIAKASNKLNPSLGDTAFLFDSLALGIKRGSPMILDNLGLQIKLGAANEEYAKSLGKSVEALTAEEKTMALLNATMAAGDQLINQVGGSVDAQADSWAQLEVAVTDYTNSLKQAFADRLIGVVGGAANTMGALEESTDRGRSSMVNMAIVTNELLRTFDPMSAKMVDSWLTPMKEGAAATMDAAAAVESHDRALMNTQAATQETAQYTDHLANSYAKAGQAAVESSNQMLSAVEATRAHNKALTEAFGDAANPVQNLLQAQKDLADSSGEWVQVTRTNAGEIGDINAQLAGDLNEDQKDAYAEILKTVGEGSAEWLAAYNALQGDLSDSTRAGLIAQRAELEGAGDTLASVYTGDIKAAEEARAAIEAAEEAIRDQFRQTAAEAILARGGITQANLDLLVGIGYLSQEEANARLAFAETQVAIEELTASQEFQKLTTEQQTAALNSLIAGQVNTADAAMRAGEQMRLEGESVEELRNRLVNTAGTYTAVVNADTSAAEAAVERLRGLINSITSGATQVTSAVGSQLAANAAAASAGQRAGGGLVAGGNLYRIGEGNRPEIYANDSGLFMLPGDNGRVFSNSASQQMMAGPSVTYNIVVNGNDNPAGTRRAVEAALDQKGAKAQVYRKMR